MTKFPLVVFAVSCMAGCVAGDIQDPADQYSDGEQGAGIRATGPRPCGTADLSAQAQAEVEAHLAQMGLDNASFALAPTTIQVHVHVIRIGSGVANGDVPDSQ